MDGRPSRNSSLRLTRMRLNNVNQFKAFNPKKAPGIDGFTSDICQTAILRDLGLFLAMANKCLQLGYFPRAWKVATIKVIPKPGAFDNAWWPALKPTARPQMPSKPLRHGNGLPERPGGGGPIRRRGVQEDDFEGLYTGLDSRSNLLESRP
ncbi:hypothetical protein EVAR_3068_1 [Eumeta japonica]|uniref:115 kDa protein in type-1 retrotransposable element R1DM n=1 Tax=Eumeta variegata TaxID=151549 RepID=A0A4C1SWG0_EUMVA|nr:hypothetical protein EVAR_3068_1 [Eumeta japonica]